MVNGTLFVKWANKKSIISVKAPLPTWQVRVTLGPWHRTRQVNNPIWRVYGLKALNNNKVSSNSRQTKDGPKAQIEKHGPRASTKWGWVYGPNIEQDVKIT